MNLSATTKGIDPATREGTLMSVRTIPNRKGIF
jgi:hypothetical protein